MQDYALPGRVYEAGLAERAAVEHALNERVKELTCLYGVARLAEAPESVGAFVQGVVCLLPPAWQYPDVTLARITFRGQVYESGNTQRSVVAEQSAPIRLARTDVGEVSVAYCEVRPESFEGPFLREERALIDALAEYVATIAGRIEAESKLAQTNRMLEVEREALRETNTALRTVLARIGEEKQELSRDVQANVQKVLLPVIQALSVELPPHKRAYAVLLKSGLLDITTPLTRNLARQAPPLTPTETAVCTMIRNGLRTKEIARLRGISSATVSRHREHIRRKLGLAARGQNLTTWLQNQAIAPTPSGRDG